MLKILCPEKQNFSKKFITEININFETDIGDYNRKKMLSKVWNQDILAIRFTTIVDNSLLKKMPNLKYIICPTTGLDHVSLELLKKNKIKIFSLFGEKFFLKHINATPEHTFALILSLIRFVSHSFNAVLRNKWRQSEFRGTELYGKTIGIIGKGRVGKKVAKFSKAFGMNVLYFDPYINTKLYLRASKLEEIAKKSDIISIHVPLNGDNIKIIGNNFFKKMKSTSFFINTSRAVLIDNVHLVQTLKNKKISGAALDVVEGNSLENPSSQCLLEYAKNNKNLLITSHIAGNTEESVEMTDMFVLSKLIKGVNYG